VSGRGGLRDVSKNITSFGISPDGKRALFRGPRREIFTVPAQHGQTRNLTNTSGVHERDAQWSPDGKQIAFISDVSGEDEIYVIAQDAAMPRSKYHRRPTCNKYGFDWSARRQEDPLGRPANNGFSMSNSPPRRSRRWPSPRRLRFASTSGRRQQVDRLRRRHGPRR